MVCFTRGVCCTLRVMCVVPVHTPRCNARNCRSAEGALLIGALVMIAVERKEGADKAAGRTTYAEGERRFFSSVCVRV